MDGTPGLHDRIARWQPELLDCLGGLYDDPSGVAERLVEIAERAHAQREPELLALDEARLGDATWFQRPHHLGYAAYTERFAGTLTGVAGRVEYLRDLGVTYLHLMPLLTPRPAPHDGGYAVADYRNVRADLGTIDDLRSLTRTLRAHGISLCLDLVLNHVAREHTWAQEARAGDGSKRDYFHVFPDRAGPDAFEANLPEVFPDFAPGNFTFDTELDGWVWTTFNDYQWDLNWANPEVLCEFASIICDLANLGVEIFRLDAIAFLWKRLGTHCQNQPEVHQITRALRAVARIACPAVIFKAEAIVGPADLPAYLGVGDLAGKVSDLAYHNSLMVQIWSMLASQEVGLATRALQRLPQHPANTTWITYVRCHDDIGWAIDDRDAADVSLSGPAHRAFLSDWYAGTFPGSWARGLVFQDNPGTGDRRICGTTASLAGLEAGDRKGLDRILLAHAITFGFGGIPVLWMGDELGLLNDADWAQEPAHADDSRWIHRPRMPWHLTEDPTETSAAITAALRSMARTRASLPHLDGSTPTEVWEARDPGVLLVVRRHGEGPLLGAYNVTSQTRRITGDVFLWLELTAAHCRDHLSEQPLRTDGDDVLIGPYQALWITTR